MPQLQVVIKRPSDVSRSALISEVRLVFPPLRTRFVGARQRVGESDVTIDYSAPTSALVWIGLAAPLADDNATVILDYEGEPVASPQLDFKGDSLLAQAFLPAGAREGLTTLDTRRLAALRDEKVLQETQRVLDTFVEQRLQFIKSVSAHDQVRGGHMLFFKEFDVATSPTFLVTSDPPLAATVIEAMKVLRRRLSKRALKETLNEGDKLAKEVVGKLSQIQLSKIRQHFPLPGNNTDIDVKRFSDAFVAFSTGQLRQPATSDWNGKPDSALFFAFAEFAIHAMESGVSRDDWEALLPVFVMSQELFMLVYRPYCSDRNQPEYVDKRLRTFQMWEGTYARTPYGIEQTIDAVRRQFDDLKLPPARLPVRHAANARKAFFKGDATPDDPCDAVKQFHFLQGEAMAEVQLDGIMRAVTRYVSEYIRTHRSATEFFVLIDMATGDGEAFGTRNQAVKAKGDGPGVILGPLSVIMDVAGNDGWPDHPTSEFHIANQNLTIVGQKNRKPFWWSFPNKEFNTYVLVVKKARSRGR
jgi:hypothetical protein